MTIFMVKKKILLCSNKNSMRAKHTYLSASPSWPPISIYNPLKIRHMCVSRSMNHTHATSYARVTNSWYYGKWVYTVYTYANWVPACWTCTVFVGWKGQCARTHPNVHSRCTCFHEYTGANSFRAPWFCTFCLFTALHTRKTITKHHRSSARTPVASNELSFMTCQRTSMVFSNVFFF